jgi:hypothetical protein
MEIKPGNPGLWELSLGNPNVIMFPNLCEGIRIDMKNSISYLYQLSKAIAKIHHKLDSLKQHIFIFLAF